KAQNLIQLKNKLRTSIVSDLLIFTVGDWFEKKQATIDRIREKFSNTDVIIRSSSLNEDTYYNSNAGKYLSIQNVNVLSNVKLTKAINKVIDSYDSKNPNNEIFVQAIVNE